jgi:hypothetical protein
MRESVFYDDAIPARVVSGMTLRPLANGGTSRANELAAKGHDILAADRFKKGRAPRNRAGSHGLSGW